VNARSRYVQLRTETEVDRRGKPRKIRVYTGVNKGKVYPYASRRQGYLKEMAT
jgi:hypothetical protein